MNINSPGTLFKQSHGFLETKVYIAGLPRKVGDTLIKQVTKKVMLVKTFCIFSFAVILQERIVAWKLFRRWKLVINHCFESKCAENFAVYSLISVTKTMFKA